MRAIAMAVLLIACKQPSYVSGNLRCAASAPKCPDGFHCAADDRCWKDGEDPGARDLTIIGEPPMDAAGVDLVASVDGPASSCSGADGTPCADGLCFGGFCDGTTCFIGGAWYGNGASDPMNACQRCNIAISRINWAQAPDDTACANNSVTGKCHAGACCTGCWTGFSCVTGSDRLACGKQGDMCKDCRTLTNGNYGNCTSDSTCSGGAYMHYFLPVECIARSCVYGLSPQCCSNGCNGSGCL